jgi:hypothetical protein
MLKLLIICGIFSTTLSACEQQKQASTEIGAIAKQTIDKVTEDIAKAQALAAARIESAEAESTSATSKQ